MKRTPNDRKQAIALPTMLAYRPSDDLTFSYMQSSHLFGRLGRVDHELAPDRCGGRHTAYGQSIAFRRLCRSSGFRAARLASTLGRMDLHQLCHTGHRDRDRSASHGPRANRVLRRHRRQFGRRGGPSDFLSSVLDTTSQLIRRFPCAV